jgi:hypothetical protein
MCYERRVSVGDLKTVCVLLLQDLLQSCARGGRRRVEDMCYERRRGRGGGGSRRVGQLRKLRVSRPQASLCAGACVCARAHGCLCVCAHVSVRGCLCVCARAPQLRV